MQLRHLRLRDLTLGCALAAMLAGGGLLARASAAELTPQQRASVKSTRSWLRSTRPIRLATP